MKKPKKLPRDVNQLAKRIVELSTTDEPEPETEQPAKNPHAVALGKLGGLKGGPARAKKLSAKKRSAIAKRAAQTRWANRGPGSPTGSNAPASAAPGQSSG